MNTNIKIRSATSADIASLESIKPVKEEGYFARCLAEQEKGLRDTYMASLNGQDVGYVILNRKPQYPLYKKLGIPEIQDLNVLPASRRHGVGTALIEHCEIVVRKEGYAQAGIGVGLHSGYGAAQRLYVKLGYIPDGSGVSYERVNVSHGEIRPIDDELSLMMVKEL
jgi:GNAT superfamily N-acetyltransferase